jgi:AcrR family transcriptional regulator
MLTRRQEILDVALALADEGGLDAVTMRAIGKRLGVTAMALYPYVASKDDLLDGLVGRLLQEIALPEAAWPWEKRLRAIAHAVRGTARMHPAVMPLLFTRPAITPDALRVLDAIYAALLDAGVPPKEVPRVERMISTVVLGFAASEVSGRFSIGSLMPRERRAQLPDAELPAHAALAAALDTPVDWDGEFDTDLDDLVAFISALAHRGC